MRLQKIFWITLWGGKKCKKWYMCAVSLYLIQYSKRWHEPASFLVEFVPRMTAKHTKLLCPRTNTASLEHDWLAHVQNDTTDIKPTHKFTTIPQHHLLYPARKYPSGSSRVTSQQARQFGCDMYSIDASGSNAIHETCTKYSDKGGRTTYGAGVIN